MYIKGCSEVGLEAVVSDSLDNLDDYDGLILPGGGDIDPEVYKEINTDSRNIEKEFDEKCFKCLEYFCKYNLPVLGICKGLQVINVYFGGTLTQHIDNHDFNALTVHKVKCFDASMLLHYYEETFLVNSYHHQCINKVGDGLKISAISEDNIIEAIESAKIIAVQWHPERLLHVDDEINGKKVFRIFKNLF